MSKNKGKAPGGLIGKIAALQSSMFAIQKEISEMTFEGSAANNLVLVEMLGTGVITRITYAPELKSEDLETLADLVVVATNEAHAKKEAMSKARLASVSKGVMPLGLRIPGL